MYMSSLKRVIIGTSSILLAGGGLLGISSLESDAKLSEMFPYGIMLIVALALWVFADGVPITNLAERSNIIFAKRKIIEGMIEFLNYSETKDYTISDVDELSTLFEKFISRLSRNRISRNSAQYHVKELVLSLNLLNEKTGMIETGERESICSFIDLCLLEIGIEFNDDVTEEWREW